MRKRAQGGRVIEDRDRVARLLVDAFRGLGVVPGVEASLII